MPKTSAGKGLRGASQAGRALHGGGVKNKTQSVAPGKKVVKTSNGPKTPPVVKKKLGGRNGSLTKSPGTLKELSNPDHATSLSTPLSPGAKRSGSTAALTHLHLSRGGGHGSSATNPSDAAQHALAQAKLNKRQKIRYHCVGPNRRRRLMRRRAMASRHSSDRNDSEEEEDGGDDVSDKPDRQTAKESKPAVRPSGPRLRGGGRGGRGGFRLPTSPSEVRSSRRTPVLPIGANDLPENTHFSLPPAKVAPVEGAESREGSPVPSDSANMSRLSVEGEAPDMPLSPVLSFHKQAFKTGDVVWAKMVDLPWWPAMVESVRQSVVGPSSGSTMQDLSLQFLGRRGTTQTTLLPNTLVMPFVAAFRSKFLPKKRTSTYVRAVREACEYTDMSPPPSIAGKHRFLLSPVWLYNLGYVVHGQLKSFSLSLSPFVRHSLSLSLFLLFFPTILH